jgi:hypothetical protein
MKAVNARSGRARNHISMLLSHCASRSGPSADRRDLELEDSILYAPSEVVVPAGKGNPPEQQNTKEKQKQAAAAAALAHQHTQLRFSSAPATRVVVA